MFIKFKKIIKKNEDIVTLWHLLKQYYFKYFFTDKELIRKKFKKRVGREVNLDNPKKFNDKLQWLKLNWYDPLAVKCADKYEVREYIKEKIGSEYLNELYAVYESVDEINFDKLPRQFVLKGTHGSGFNIICKDKNKMNWKKEKKKMKRWLKRNYFWDTREWVYKDIKPKIICEKYLSDKSGNPPNDYKIFCFNGKPKLICVDFDKYGIKKDNNYKLKRNIYDLEWNFLDKQISVPNDPDYIVDKPKKLDKMLELSEILSEKFPHVRVDWYNMGNKIIFGELTFFNTSGMGKIKPEKFEITMGDWLELPK